MGMAIMLGMNLVVVVVGSSVAALPPAIARALAPVMILAFLVGSGILMARMFRTQKIFIEVRQGGLVVDEGRGGVFPVTGALLGPWRTPGLGVIAGSVLHLFDGERSFRIGGSDHTLPPGLLASVPATEDVHAQLPLDDFQSLLSLLPLSSPAPARREAPALRFPLLPNPGSPRAVFTWIAPWFGTLVLAGLLSAILEATGLFSSLAGQYIGIALLAPVILGGLTLSVVLTLRRRAAIEIEIDATEVRIRDAKSGSALAAAPRGRVRAERCLWRAHARGGRIEYAALTVSIPGHPALTLCVYDARCLWPHPTRHVWAPRYIIGPPDWARLVELLSPNI